ncbi:MAG: hypothetical protein ACK4JD_06905 [Thermoflexales bacterium]
MKIRRRVERWAYLRLAANRMAGRLDWQWTTDLKQESAAQVAQGWQEKVGAALI